MLIKSIFITSYITLLHLVSGYSFYQFYQIGFNWLWFAVLLTSLPGALFFEVLLLAKPFARTSSRLLPLTLLKAIALVGVVLLNFNSLKMDLLSIALAPVGFIGWLVYDYWYSKFEHRNTNILQSGKQLPNLELETTDGKVFNSRDLIGRSAIYIFYRGNWCPLCMAQVKEVAAQYRQLTKHGSKIVLVSPQSHKNSLNLSKKFDVPFFFLVDRENKVAKELGILAKNGLPMGMQLLGYDSDTVMPTVIITDKENKIIFADLTDNYRIRPEPELFIKILEQNAR